MAIRIEEQCSQISQPDSLRPISFDFTARVLTGKTLTLTANIIFSDALGIFDALLCSVANASGVEIDEIELFYLDEDKGKILPLVTTLHRIPLFVSEGVELLVVFRLRGGKGKAGFQKNLKRKGREYTRAVRAGQIQNRETATATTGNRTNNNVQRNIVGERFARARARTAARASAAKTDLAVVNLPPDHPIEVLKRDQARERARLNEWANKMSASIENGLNLIAKQARNKAAEDTPLSVVEK